MARNGSGTYSAPANSVNPAVAATTIDASDFNDLLDDLETALSESIARDGQTTTTQVIKFASGIQSDTIVENSSNTGVTVDSVLLKDGGVSLGTAGTLIFEGATANDFETTLTVTDPTADRTITLPDSSGTIIANIVEDTTPQLGGTLDINSKSIQFTGATVTDVTGSDTLLVSGTAGTADNLAKWNADGDAIDGGVAVDTDDTLAADSDAKIPTQQAVKAYVDTNGLGETLETAQATTSGTEVDYTSLPAGIETLQVMFDAVSLSGTNDLLVQIGDSGGLHTTGYVASAGTGTSVVDSTTGFIIRVSSASRNFMGSVMLNRMDGNKWSASVAGADTGAGVACVGGGVVTLDTALDRVRVLATGADTFDAGAVNIRYWS